MVVDGSRGGGGGGGVGRTQEGVEGGYYGLWRAINKIILYFFIHSHHTSLLLHGACCKYISHTKLLTLLQVVQLY